MPTQEQRQPLDTLENVVPSQVQPITYYGDPALQKPSQSITQITEDIKNLASAMHETMRENNGIGLAAPQVGRNLCMVAVDLSRGEEDSETGAYKGSPGEKLLLPQMPLTLINPEIVSVSETTDENEEGCLSLPGIYAPVERPESCVLKTERLTGETLHIECGGLLARCLQHEIDHLRGILFVQRLRPDAYREVARDVKRLYKRTQKQLKHHS